MISASILPIIFLSSLSHTAALNSDTDRFGSSGFQANSFQFLTPQQNEHKARSTRSASAIVSDNNDIEIDIDIDIDIDPPSPFDKAATARWITHNTAWGSLSTISSRGDRRGKPFSNISSFSDGAPGASTGNVYFLHSPLDASMIDVMKDDSVSLALSEMQTGYCQGKKYDAEDPRCARLSLSGRMVKIDTNDDDDDEIKIAKDALFSKHPSMKDWYYGDEDSSHDFAFWKLELEEIWLVDFFGGAALISLEAWKRGTDNNNNDKEGDFLLLPVASLSIQSMSMGNESPDNRDDMKFITRYLWFLSLVCAFAIGSLWGRSGHHASCSSHQSFARSGMV